MLIEFDSSMTGSDASQEYRGNEVLIGIVCMIFLLCPEPYFLQKANYFFLFASIFCEKHIRKHCRLEHRTFNCK